MSKRAYYRILFSRIRSGRMFLMSRVIALGELLIDFTPLAGRQKIAFEQNAGGAPANVLAAAAKLGIKTSFIGCVGEDAFGRYLRDFLEKCGIGFDHLRTDPCHHTTLAFVQLREDGDRDFSFYRNHGADKMLSPEDISEEMFERGDIFHFGSISMTDEPAKSATKKAIGLAKERDCLISYDPNLRPPLWRSLEEAKETMLSVMGEIDLLKVSEEELQFLTGEEELETGARKLEKEYGIPLLLVTRGSEGCCFLHKREWAQVEAFRVEAVDTTGAGDSFLGAMLFQLMREGRPIPQLSLEEMRGFVGFANKTAAIVATRYGSAEIMPSYEEVMAAKI